MPTSPSQGDGPVSASALTWAAGGAGVAGGTGVTTAGAPEALLSLWASFRTTAAWGSDAVVAVPVPVLGLRPFRSSRLTPSAPAFAELGPISVWPAAT